MITMDDDDVILPGRRAVERLQQGFNLSYRAADLSVIGVLSP
jgi:hypothetical protein